MASVVDTEPGMVGLGGGQWLVGTCPGELEGGLELTQDRTKPQALPKHLEKRAPGMRLREIPKMSFCLACPEKGANS